MARQTGEIMTAWVDRTGRIEWHPGVGFPDGTLPLCCGTREAIKPAMRARAWNGHEYRVPGMDDTMTDQQAFEAVEKLRVSLNGSSKDIFSYFSGMNRRDVG
ncbi:hypothetical protein OQ496_09345 [Acetobacter suratthaniensis]|uniref:Uncharacterized protein n=1 Tax=Acetobacter suratthaniensis TaxID=1502841 RepID=A0ABS3LMD9_9PROT|nr:hypothetical protein [Acetobacter suratthaniensis]MBO1328534.1 hypothetical protein [Acetobacter suratthaniensis]MCX2566663.1 hypothetical protein [Acetobacter suratthaniensis]